MKPTSISWDTLFLFYSQNLVLCLFLPSLFSSLCKTFLWGLFLFLQLLVPKRDINFLRTKKFEKWKKTFFHGNLAYSLSCTVLLLINFSRLWCLVGCWLLCGDEGALVPSLGVHVFSSQQNSLVGSGETTPNLKVGLSLDVIFILIFFSQTWTDKLFSQRWCCRERSIWHLNRAHVHYACASRCWWIQVLSWRRPAW